MQALSPAGSALPASKTERGRRAVRNALRLREVIRAWRPDVLHAYMTETSAVAAAARWPHRRSVPHLLEAVARPVDRAGPHLLPAGPVDQRPVRSHPRQLQRRARRGDREGGRARGKDPGRVQRRRYRPVRAGPPARGARARARDPARGDGGRHGRQPPPLQGPPGGAHGALADRRGRPASGFSSSGGTETLRSRCARRSPAWDCRTGWCSRARARTSPTLLRLMDVFVSASHEEGLSNSILEAMAAARPIVATTVGGSVEQIVPEASGLLVPPQDVSGDGNGAPPPCSQSPGCGRAWESPRGSAPWKSSLSTV